MILIAPAVINTGFCWIDRKNEILCPHVAQFHSYHLPLTEILTVLSHWCVALEDFLLCHHNFLIQDYFNPRHQQQCSPAMLLHHLPVFRVPCSIHIAYFCILHSTSNHLSILCSICNQTITLLLSFVSQLFCLSFSCFLNFLSQTSHHISK